MNILLTRPELDSKMLASQLKELNIGAIISPLLKIVINPVVLTDCKQHQAIILSSKHAIAALVGLEIQRSIPVYCVGDATSKLVCNEGFYDVYSASGNLIDLTRLIKKKLEPLEGSILYLSGCHTAGDIVADLKNVGFIIEHLCAYKAEAVCSLSKNAILALEADSVQGVFLYSPRSAKILIELIKKLRLQKFTTRLEAYCISSAVSDTVKELQWKRVSTARRPNNIEMLELVKKLR